MKYVLSTSVLLMSIGASAAPQTITPNDAVYFLSKCMKEAASAVQGTESLSVETTSWDFETDSTISYAVYTTGMDGPKVYRRLLVHANRVPNPAQDAPGLTFSCEIQESTDGK